MTISLERALKYRRQYFMLNALAHVLPTGPSLRHHPSRPATPHESPESPRNSPIRLL